MNSYPVRVLHVLGAMNRGGAETWLIHVLRHIDSSRFRNDFLVHTSEHCAYDDEILSRGSAIMHCASAHRPWVYSKNLRRLLREGPQYDIVHSHVHHFSGIVLRIARRAGVPVRIAHSHNDTRTVDRSASLPRRAYLALMETWVRRYATHGIAASAQAAEALFGPGWKSDPRVRILFCGIDLAPFERHEVPCSLRPSFGISDHEFVVGHVGRFSAQKNHNLILDIFQRLLAFLPHSRLLLVGDGPLKSDVEARARRLGIANRVTFAGARVDVPQLMAGAMDAFLLPSLHEGLPLVLLEAQAAGRFCVISDNIAPEVDVVPPLVRRVSLSSSPNEWAQALLDARIVTGRVEPTSALASVRQSPFNITLSCAALESFYSAAVQIPTLHSDPDHAHAPS